MTTTLQRTRGHSEPICLRAAMCRVWRWQSLQWFWGLASTEQGSAHPRHHQHPAGIRSGCQHMDELTAQPDSDPAALLPCGYRCGQHSGSGGWLHWFYYNDLGGDQRHHWRLRKPDANRHAYGKPDGDANTDANSDNHGHTHGDANTDANADSRNTD